MSSPPTASALGSNTKADKESSQGGLHAALSVHPTPSTGFFAPVSSLTNDHVNSTKKPSKDIGPVHRSSTPGPGASSTSSPSSSASSLAVSSGEVEAIAMELQQGDNIKLKKEGPRGIWFAELNGTMVKLAVTFVGFPEDGKEEKKASNEKKVKKTKKAKRTRKDDAKGAEAEEEVDEVEAEDDLSSFQGEALKERVSQLSKAISDELDDVRMELALIVRAFHQDYVESAAEARALPSALRLNRTTDEIMFEKMLESPYLATVGFKKNIPDITGKVVEVKNADAAKQMAQSETTSSVELALAPPGEFFYHDLLTLPDFNLGVLSEEELRKLTTLELDALSYLDKEDFETPKLMVMHMFRSLGLTTAFPNFDERRLWRFVSTISCRYRKVPFHNFFHAFNVTQTLYFFLTTCNAKHLLGPLEMFSLLIATLCHDADHPGLNNTFHSKAQTRISNMHKKSTLENHHLLNGYAVLSREECNVIKEFKVEERDLFSRYLRDLVLATDLALHGIILRNMDERRKQLSKQYNKGKPQLSDEDKIIVMCCLIKCADLSNEIRPTEMAQRWAKMVITEFFAQSDKERELELPVTPFMDREKIIVANEQINFITKLCTPLYNALQGVYPGMVVCLDQMKTNLKNWNQRLSAFYGKDEEKKKTLTNRSIWERDQVKDTKAKLSDVISKQSSGPSGPSK